MSQQITSRRSKRKFTCDVSPSGLPERGALDHANAFEERLNAVVAELALFEWALDVYLVKSEGVAGADKTEIDGLSAAVQRFRAMGRELEQIQLEYTPSVRRGWAR